MTGKMYEGDDLGEFVRDTTPAVSQKIQYVIQAGDVLDVVFLYHSDLTTLGLPVRSDGMISLPHVGDAQAAGLTPMGLDSALTVQFAQILKDPNLSVMVKQFRTKRVYVLGEVGNPGGVKFQEELSILQAIAEAGGIITGGKPRNSILIRQEGDNTIVGVEIDLQAILDGSAIYNNIPLKDYDIVYVPKSAIHSVAEFMQKTKEILSIPVDAYFTAWQIRNIQASYEFFKKRSIDE
jgi:polysaccharide export outer membrane protein